MKGKRVISLVFSDLHLNMWAKFNADNQRTLNGFKVLDIIGEQCTKLGVPALFCGDLFHQNQSISQELHHLMYQWLEKVYSKWPQWRIYAIGGNHDIAKVNLIDNPTNGWLEDIANGNPFYLIHNDHPIILDYLRDTHLYGVPYIDHNIGLNDYLKNLKIDSRLPNILLLHTDYPGARDTDDRLVDSVENLNINILNRFSLVLCGHIHKPQRLSKKVYMIGAPLQQRRTDKNCEMGYWELYEDLSLKFIPLKQFPKFIDVESKEDIKEDGNYYTIIPPKASIKEVSNHKITKQLSKKQLAHRYMKARGIKDKNRERLLTNILTKAEDQ